MLRLGHYPLRLARLSSARLIVAPTFRPLSTSVAPSEAGLAVVNPAIYCRDYVRKRDYQSYLIGGFYPWHLQGAFFALRAFYVSWLIRASLHNGCMQSYKCLRTLHHFVSTTAPIGIPPPG